jgi:hypothetical protein
MKYPHPGGSKSGLTGPGCATGGLSVSASRPRGEIPRNQGSAMNDIARRSYEILGLPEGSSREEIEAAYRSLVETRGGAKKDWKRIKEAAWAYDALIAWLPGPESTDVPGGSERTRSEEGSLPVSGPREGDGAGISLWLRDLLFGVEEGTNPLTVVGRGVIFAVAVIWGFLFIMRPLETNYSGRSFMHLINIPFHEAGHLLFSPLGEFMAYLGGTLMQVLVPAVCGVAFLRSGDRFGASVAMWWVGQSLIDAAPYINDARVRELMLIGGVTGQEVPEGHDWYVLLGKLGLLSQDRTIARLTHLAGSLVIILSLLWGAYLLRLQFRKRDRGIGL